MGIPFVRGLAQRWHNMGMGRCREKILPVLGMILKMLNEAKVDLENKTVVELGPGQTPDMLFAALIYGASMAIGIDVHTYMKRRPLLLSTYEETIRWINEAVAGGQLPRTKTSDKNFYAKQGYIPSELFALILYDGKHFPLDDESVHVIWSRSVLEHVKDYENVIAEMKRVLRPGGCMCHIIDLRDHTTFGNGKDWLRFLSHTESLWNMMASNRTSWSNRLRASEWERAFQSAGFHLLNRNVDVLPFHKDFRREKLVLPFRDFDEEDLTIAWWRGVCQKPS
jgi:SAM-dependent methyltransferase